MKSSLLSVSAMFFCLFGCEVRTSTGQIDTSNASEPDTTIAITTFQTPADIEGCGYYFGPDEETFRNNVFVFVANMKGVGYIMADGVLQKLTLSSTTSNPEKFGDHTDVYINDSYRVTVHMHYVSQVFQEDTWMIEGSLWVETKDGKKSVNSVFGERGC